MAISNSVSKSVDNRFKVPVSQRCRSAKEASRVLGGLGTKVKNSALRALADSLTESADQILKANMLDLASGKAEGLSSALIDRLALSSDRIDSMVSGVRVIEKLDDSAGEILSEQHLSNGLRIKKIRVPLGVIAVVYEARPNVTIDAAALCLKSGNTVVLRGSKSALNTNIVLAEIAREAISKVGIPADSITILDGGDRSELAELATQDKYVDLIIPRGGEGLKQALQGVATVPVIYAASGNCHIYVDKTADIEMATKIVYNAKVQRPGVCNAAETLLINREIAGDFLPQAAKELLVAGVQLRLDSAAHSIVSNLEPSLLSNLQEEDEFQSHTSLIRKVTEEDYSEEFLSLIIAVKVVDSVGEAISHVNHYGSGHSEAIITGDSSAAERFQTEVDAACVYVNASTRFTDGGEFGMGAEIGNSTQKLHARGPVGMNEIMTYKYLIDGSGQTRS